jgi:hypothetical protein
VNALLSLLLFINQTIGISRTSIFVKDEESDHSFVFSHLLSVKKADKYRLNKIDEIITSGKGRGSLLSSVFSFILIDVNLHYKIIELPKLNCLQSEVLTSVILSLLNNKKLEPSTVTNLLKDIIPKLEFSEISYEHCVYLELKHNVETPDIEIQYNYSELWMQVSKTINGIDVGLEITPTTADWFDVDGWSGVNYAINSRWKYQYNLDFSATYGKQVLEGTGAQGWEHWNIGLDYKALSCVFGLRYHDSNIDKYHKVYSTPAGIDIFNDRVVLSISRSF